jgi:hypothetical protein
MSERKLFLDCDGVLADFDGGVVRLSGLSPDELTKRDGRGGFWKQLARAEGFSANLDPMPGAMEMVERVAHLDPIILTGLPLGNWAEPQKRLWAKRHFPGLEIITCMARDKWKFGDTGDVLVDDREKARAPWEEKAGGAFILHRTPDNTLDALGEYFPL